LIVIVSPGVPVPIIVGVVSLVVGLVPVSHATEVTLGAAGAVTSSITVPDHAVSQIPIAGKISTAQVAPDSRRQAALHPSPAIAFPSSHCSPAPISLFPHPSATVTVTVATLQFADASQVVTEIGLVPPVIGVITAHNHVPLAEQA
jgi:hypothetical protein